MDASNDHNGPDSPENEQYYRLVPVTGGPDKDEQRFNLRELLQHYWKKRRIVYWCVVIFFAAALFFALFSPAEYTSNASIIPEYELQDKVNEAIESYGLLFGLTGSIRENRTPSYLLELYPYMINSVSFKKELMHKPFQYAERDTAITMYHYFTEIYRPSVLQTLYNYTLGLPGQLLDSMQQPASGNTKPSGAASASRDSSKADPGLEVPILHFSPPERKVLNELTSRITAMYVRRTGIVQVSATMPESNLAAKLVKVTLQTLHDKAAAYKTGKARVYKDFLTAQENKSRKELDQARSALIAFNDAEGRQQPLNKRMELQSSYEVNLDRYHMLVQQLNRIELSIEEQLPAFRLLDDITVPSKQIQPNRKLIVFLGVLLGFFIAISWITASYILTKEELVSS